MVSFWCLIRGVPLFINFFNVLCWIQLEALIIKIGIRLFFYCKTRIFISAQFPSLGYIFGCKEEPLWFPGEFGGGRPDCLQFLCLLLPYLLYILILVLLKLLLLELGLHAIHPVVVHLLPCMVFHFFRKLFKIFFAFFSVLLHEKLIHDFPLHGKVALIIHPLLGRQL